MTQVFQVEAREQGAVSLWALAGHTLKQQRLMAEHIGYHFILELILSSSDRMQYVGRFSHFSYFCFKCYPSVLAKSLMQKRSFKPK